MLIKGVLLFLGFGLLSFIGILGIEYFLWLNSTSRFLLLLFCIALELFLFIRYIFIPLFYLFQLKNGIGNKEAAVLIGEHFPEVGDTLYNLLDLDEDPNKTELLLASIEQRSENLKLIPFVNAVNFKDVVPYFKYIAIPLVLFLIIGLSGNWRSYFDSYNRVLNYDLAYEPPAPFSFQLLTTNLEVLETEDITITTQIVGNIKPETVYLVLEDKEILLQEINGTYQYTFKAPLSNYDFYFKGNNVVSRDYHLKAMKAPSISNFKMVLEYPSYTNLPKETLESTGNAVFPEGTKVHWSIDSNNTDKIDWIGSKDSITTFIKKDKTHHFTKYFYSSQDYVLSTSNSNVKDFEKLSYSLKIIKDASPTISVTQVLDSMQPNVAYFSGNTTDDYKVKKLKVFCYEIGKEDNPQSILLEEPNINFHSFYYTFPSGFNLEEGKSYKLFFQVKDNDAIHGGKSVKSKVFDFSLLDSNELNNKQLESNKSLVNEINKSFESAKQQKEVLDKLTDQQKESRELNYTQKKDVQQFLKKQKEQESLMQKFSKQLKQNLENNTSDSKQNKLLQERLERQELKAKKNEELLENLSKIADKINKDDLQKKLEELGKNQKNSQRNLEQLLELTKNYYVTEKLAQIANELQELSKEQEELSKNEDVNNLNKQKDLNQQFNAITKEFEELQLDNKDLKKPLPIDNQDNLQDSIKEDQINATNSLKEKQEGGEQDKDSKQQRASKKQKSASKKMEELSKSLEQSSSSGSSSESIAEDAEMLRQILDNLITFSFKQEALYIQLNNNNSSYTTFSKPIKEQQDLRLLFEHIDDSLFSLSLRREELSEFVNEQIFEVYYNVDKTLEQVSDGNLYQGISSQKYTLTAANSLSDFLVKILDNMEQSMQMGEGEGESEQGFQLPDIIKSQGDIKQKMQNGQKPGKGDSKGESGKGKQGTEGASKKNGASGDNGKQDGNGKQSGISGEGPKGENGKNGKPSGGKNGNGGSSTQGDGMSESELKEIYEIYQSQQTIRQALEDQLKNMLNDSDRKLGEKLLLQMEEFEDDMLENGITPNTINKANTIAYELLKLENAALKKGKKKERESTTNSSIFSNPITTKPSLLDNYSNEEEVLKRQSLPLRHIFNNRVKTYFSKDD